MYLGILKGVVVSTAVTAHVFWVSIVQVGDWARVSTLAIFNFSTYFTTQDQP